MNAIACILLKNLLNLPVTEGHFVIVDKNSVDVPWVQSNALTLKCYDGDIQIRPFSFIVGRINGISDKAGMTRMEFFYPFRNSYHRLQIVACLSIVVLVPESRN